jgi:hypothetical protein
MLQGENMIRKQEEFQNLCNRIEKAMDLIVDSKSPSLFLYHVVDDGLAYHDGLKGSLDLFTGVIETMRACQTIYEAEVTGMKRNREELVTGRFQLMHFWVKKQQVTQLLSAIEHV